MTVYAYILLRCRMGKLKDVISEVQKIEKAAEETGFSDPILESVEKAVRELSSDDSTVAQKAKNWLIEMGIFAVDYLRRERLSLPLKAQKEVDEILKIAEVSEYITPKVFSSVKDFYKRLLTGDASQKIALLEEVFLIMGEPSVGLFMFIAQDKNEFAEVRSFCVNAIGRLHRYDELVKLLKSDDGRMRFVAALSLADNGIYIGCQQLIDALKMKDADIRKSAFERLVKIAKCDFSFDPEKEASVQVEALSKWQEWWKANEERLTQEGIKQLAPQTVSADEQMFAEERARKGYQLWASGDLKEALKNLERAVEIDPGNVKNRANYAILLYLVGKDNEKANKEFQRLLFAFSDKLTEEMRKEIRYHLGNLALSEGDWKEALHQFQSILFLDRRFASAYGGLAQALFLQMKKDSGMQDENGLLTVEGEAVLKRAIGAIDIAVAYTDSEIAKIRDPEVRSQIRIADKEVITKSGKLMRIDTDKEIEEYERTLVSSKAAFFDLLGKIYGYLKRWENAVEAYTEAVTCEPENAYYWARLGLALALSGDIDGAKKSYLRALKVDPNCAEAKEGLNSLGR